MAAALHVVLVHWNQPERCHAALAAFAAQGLALRVTVVDNGSDSEALAGLKEGLPDDVELIETGANLGFGPGANVGLRRWLAHGDSEWVAVAPHDALPGPGCLPAVLAAVAARPGAGLACADVGEGRTPVVDPYFGGITLDAAQIARRSRRRGAVAPAGNAADGWEPAGYPHGTLLFARRACLADIGLFDERYFAYCEEADLGERARRAGWEVGIVRGAPVNNPYLGGQADIVDYLMLRNTLLLVRSHFGRYRAFVRGVIALGHLTSGVLRPGSRPWIFAPAARVRALADHARRRYGPPPSSLTSTAPP